MTGFLNRVADVDGFASLECVIKRCLAKGNCIEHLIALLINEVKLNVFRFLTHDLAGTRIIDFAGDKYRLAVARTIRIEHAQITQQGAADVTELDFTVDIDCRSHLFIMDVLLDILGEAFAGCDRRRFPTSRDRT